MPTTTQITEITASKEQEVPRPMTQSERNRLSRMRRRINSELLDIGFSTEFPEVREMTERLSCLTSVSSYLDESDAAGVGLLREVCLEMTPMNPDSYPESLSGAMRVLREFAEKHEVQVSEDETANTHELTSEVLAELDDHSRGFLDACYKIDREHRGSNTPVEEFLRGLIVFYDSDSGTLTPDEVADCLKEFKQNFKDMLGDTRKFLRNYPDLVKAES